MKRLFKKTKNGLVPDDPETVKWFDRLKVGDGVLVEAKKPRNYLFLKKYFALLNCAFDNWEPPRKQIQVGNKFVTPEKCFDRFRSDVVILSGHYYSVFRIDGTCRIEPKSISFSKMSEEVFEQLYQSTITVLIGQLWHGLSHEEVDKIVDAYLSFA